MATYTENFNLIKPDDEDYYDVADFNENMDVIDEALAESLGGADKIGLPTDSVTDTVFGKLNGFISPDGKGVRVVKSIQWKTYDTRSPSAYSPAINPVDTSRTVVLPIRMECNASKLMSFSFKLSETSLTVSATANTTEYQAFGFWIIEFY